MLTMILPVAIFLILFYSSTPSSTEETQVLSRCARTVVNCVLAPETTEGPYSWNTTMMRQNVSEDRPGIRFRLQITVTNINTCEVVTNAAVEIWHCDAMGIYSHYIEASNNVLNPHTDNQTFLRGMQLTDSNGQATFDTIYPGWYVGRTTHIHVRVHLNGVYQTATGYYADGKLVKTGQLFFNDSFTNLVATQSPYSNHSVVRTLNSADNIYSSNGYITLMNVQYVDSTFGFSSGLVTSVTLGVNGTSNSTSVSSSTVSSTTGSSSTISSNGERAFSSLWWHYILFVIIFK